MLTNLLETTKIDLLLNSLKVQLERFMSSNTASAETVDLADQAHRLVSSAGMLGFSIVSKYFSRFEGALLGNAQADVTFEERSRCFRRMVSFCRTSSTRSLAEHLSDPMALQGGLHMAR
jgi:HPt (histidine-containing phosphotransfer) domain-containing protein